MTWVFWRGSGRAAIKVVWNLPSGATAQTSFTAGSRPTSAPCAMGSAGSLHVSSAQVPKCIYAKHTVKLAPIRAGAQRVFWVYLNRNCRTINTEKVCWTCVQSLGNFVPEMFLHTFTVPCSQCFCLTECDGMWCLSSWLWHSFVYKTNKKEEWTEPWGDPLGKKKGRCH